MKNGAVSVSNCFFGVAVEDLQLVSTVFSGDTEQFINIIFVSAFQNEMGLWSEGAAAGLLDYLIQGICMRGARKIK
jgi:hypothetical protein